MPEEGTISCVNAGYYGSPVITKSITIDCKLGGGAVDVQVIQIQAPGKNVRLRNISLNGFASYSTIIDIISAASVQFENVLVTGSIGVGIHDHRTGPGKLFISDSSIVANSGPGIVVAPQGGSVIGAVLHNVIVRDNNYGIAVGNGGRVTIKHSVFSGNTTAGIEGDPGAIIEIEDTLMSFNGIGILSNNGASVEVSNSGIISNSTAISGPTLSYGNNRISRNSSNGTVPTPIGFR